MPVAYACPKCRKGGNAPDNYAGKTVQCRSCSTRFIIPVPAAAHGAAAGTDRTMMAKAAPVPPPSRPPAAAGTDRTLMAKPAPIKPPPAPARRSTAAPPPRKPAAPRRSSSPPPIAPRKSGGMGLILVILLVVLLLGGAGVGGYFFFFKGQGPSGSGQQYGVIEIGNAGLRGLVVSFFGTGDSLDWEIKKELDRVVDLGKLTEDGKSFRPDALTDTRKTVTSLTEEMKNEYKIPADRIYVICSSGLFSGFKGDKAAIDKAKSALKDELKEPTGGRIDFVDEEQEAHYTILACVTPKDREEFSLFDVGSGNTKGGYILDGQFYAWNVNYGTRTMFSTAEKQAKATGKPLEQALVELGREKVAKPLQQGVESKPGLIRRGKVILTGGIVWGLATYTHPNDLKKERVKLTPVDIQTFAEMVANKDEKQILDTVLRSVEGDEMKSAVRKEVGRVQDKVAKDKGKNRKLMGGAEILKAMSTELRFGDKDVSFFRKGRFAWPMGYLMKKAGIQ